MVCTHPHGEKKILEGPGTADWILAEMTQLFPFSFTENFPPSCKLNGFEKKKKRRSRKQVQDLDKLSGVKEMEVTD